jgi:hypothetical protein
VNDLFTVWIPTGRAINPVSGTNWEGVGIEPDIAVPQDEALDKAHLAAVGRLLEKGGEEPLKQVLKWAHDGLKARLEPAAVDAETLKTYAGHYGPAAVTFENGALFVPAGAGKVKLIPVSPTMFVPEGGEGPRIEFAAAPDGRSVQATVHFRNGRKEIYKKTAEK